MDERIKKQLALFRERMLGIGRSTKETEKALSKLSDAIIKDRKKKKEKANYKGEIVHTSKV